MQSIPCFRRLLAEMLLGEGILWIAFMEIKGKYDFAVGQPVPSLKQVYNTTDFGPRTYIAGFAGDVAIVDCALVTRRVQRVVSK